MNPLHQVIQTSRKAPRTKALYIGRVNDFIRFAGARPEDWTTIAVESWRDYLLTERGLKSTTVSVYINALRYVSRRYAKLHGGVDFAAYAEGPMPDLSRGPSRSSKGDALTEEDLRALVQTCGERETPPSLRDYTMMMVALHAAFRREELATLQIENIKRNEDELLLSVVVKGQRWHTVEVGGEAAEALEAWLMWLVECGVETGAVFRRLRIWAGPGGWRIDRGLSGNGVYKILCKRAETAGVDNFHPHRFRHTFVTMARERGWQDWQIAKVTGHRSAATNAMVDRYTHHRDGAVGANFPRFGL